MTSTALCCRTSAKLMKQLPTKRYLFIHPCSNNSSIWNRSDCCRISGLPKRSASDSSSYGVAGRGIDVAMVTENPEDWKPIYRFRHIKPVAILARAKLTQTIFSVSLGPMAAVGLSQGIIDPATVSALLGIGIFATGMLYAMSQFFRRIIGVISISRDFDQSLVRIGYLDFWGRRRTVISSINDIEPVSDKVGSSSGVYFGKVIFHGFVQNPLRIDYLYLPIRGVDVLDKDDVDRVFGPIMYSSKWYGK